MCSKQNRRFNLSVFNMITEINGSNTLTKDISCECKCKFDGTKCNSNQWWNNEKCWSECKKMHVCERYYVWNPATFNFENGKYLANIMDDSTIICDEVIKSCDEETKNIPTNFNEKNWSVKQKVFIFYLYFY